MSVNDSDALYARYSIVLQGVQDIPLMENASRLGHTSGKKFAHGLAQCSEKDAPIPPLRTSYPGKKFRRKRMMLFSPEKRRLA